MGAWLATAHTFMATRAFARGTGGARGGRDRGRANVCARARATPPCKKPLNNAQEEERPPH
eukprot:1737729-Lingulodinium_polyedra.AAC.1